MLSLKPTNESERRLLASLCPDESAIFKRWCNRVEQHSASQHRADIEHIKAKHLTLHQWFDHFNRGLTAVEAVTKEAN